MSKLESLVNKVIEKVFQSVWGPVTALFERRPVRTGVSAAFLAAAVITGNFYVDRTRQYQEIVSTTIRAEGEGAPQRFNVLEAFIMSAIDSKLTESIKNATISNDFFKRLQEMHGELSKPTLSAKLPGVYPPNYRWGVKLSIPDNVDSVDSLPLQNAILTDNATDGYLFFPLNLLRTGLERNYARIFNEARQNPYSRTLAAAVAPDRPVADDIAISRNLTPVMRTLITTHLLKDNEDLKRFGADLQPARVYYITKNGVNRQVNAAGAAEQQFVYRNMFRSTTFFPSRPYYVEAFKRLTPGALSVGASLIKDSFYVSQPYPDLGGLGVVITLARPVRYPRHSDAAICFDLRVRLDNPAFQLRRRLEEFGAKHQEVKCRIGFRSDIECEPSVEGGMDFRLRRELKNRLTKAMNEGDLSTVVGNISILDDQTMQEGASQSGFLDFLKYPVEIIFGYNSRPITFAIPLGPLKGKPDVKELEARFMISYLNLERFYQITALLGFVSVSSLALAFFMVLSSWHGEMRARRNSEEAFKAVDGVLREAKTPYCRLRADDTIADCNTAFCGLLKMPENDESVQKLKDKTFESLVAKQSKNTYRSIQQERKAGVKKVEPYKLWLTCDGGGEVETQVTSGVVPGRTPGKLPETFGIVISK